MKTIGELCDTHGKYVSQGGKDPFYITVVEPLMSEIEAISGLKGSYEVEGRFDVKALARFRKGDKTSHQLLIDYTGEAPDGGRSLMIWMNPNNLPAKLKAQVVNHPSGPVFPIPRNWAAEEFSQLIRFDD